MQARAPETLRERMLLALGKARRHQKICRPIPLPDQLVPQRRRLDRHGSQSHTSLNPSAESQLP
jgi:hypothetical protein